MSAEVSVTPSGADFLSVKFTDHADNDGGNSDRFTFELTTPGGQPITVGGRETDRLEFVITGPVELGEFLAAMDHLARVLPHIVKLRGNRHE